MAEEMVEELEERIGELRVQARQAYADGDIERYQALRHRQRRLEEHWEEIVEQNVATASISTPNPSEGPLLPVREQVYQILTLLGRPAAPKLIVTVHEAFFSGELTSPQMTHLRRDEERSFQSSPNARPYYLCSALSAHSLTAARGLLAVSTWPLETRAIGPQSPRVDLLIATTNVARHMQRVHQPSPATRRLLWRLASGIPDAGGAMGSADPEQIIRAAKAELAVHEESDRHDRRAAALRARNLPPIQQLFGAKPLGAVQSLTAP